MKKLGLVGGTGPESTLMYYKELNSRIDELTQEKAMPDVAIESVNFRRAWEYVTAADYDSLAEYLSEKVTALQKGGSEVVALTAVTMHVVIDEIVKRTGCSLISIPQAVADYTLSKGYKKLGLLGTAFTMEMDYMKIPIEKAGIEIAVPNKEERDLVAKRIFEELEKGIVKEETLTEFRRVIERMKTEDGIEAVILGCTELPILLNSDNSPVPCLDSVDIHIEKLIEAIQ